MGTVGDAKRVAASYFISPPKTKIKIKIARKLGNRMAPALTLLMARLSKDLEAGCNGDGWSCIFVTQPPNSPDTNFNDLEFF